MEENTLNPKLILFGAGASVPAGIPSAIDMFEKIYTDLSAEKAIWNEIGGAINLAIGGIQLRNATINQRPLVKIDIEDLYATLRELTYRNQNIIAPFVGSWSQELISVESPKLKEYSGLLTDMLELDLRETFNRNQFSSTRSTEVNLPKFRDALRSTLRVINGEGASSEFVFACEVILSQISNRVWISDADKVSYLDPLIKSSNKRPLWIASLNYDNAIELAAARGGVSVDIGIQANKVGANFLGLKPLSLAKLHGSVNWSINQALTMDIEDKVSRNPALIFGAGNKLKVEGPYLDLLLAFRNQLNKSKQLEVFGYSFRDSHVNHLLLSWLSQNPDAIIDVIDPALTKEMLFANWNKGLEGQTVRSEVLDKKILIHRLSISDWISTHY